MAISRKKKTPPRKKPRRWIIPKLLMLLGIGGLVAFIVAIFVMEQELSRIGFFKNIKRPSFQLPAPLQNKSSTAPPAASPSPPAGVEPPRQETTQPAASASAQATEDISHEERKQLQDVTTSRSTEKLSQDDRKRLEEVLRSR